jgi:hypothetical protein
VLRRLTRWSKAVFAGVPVWRLDRATAESVRAALVSLGAPLLDHVLPRNGSPEETLALALAVAREDRDRDQSRQALAERHRREGPPQA